MSTDLDVERKSRHEREDDVPVVAGEQAIPPSVGEETEESNVFRVLGAQARTRSLAQLWVAAVGGAVDAGLLWWRHPMLVWLAAGCAAVAAYGVWGLLDRGIGTRSTRSRTSHELVAQLSALRDLTAVAGTAAALWAVLSFMAVALGNWNH